MSRTKSNGSTSQDLKTNIANLFLAKHGFLGFAVLALGVRDDIDPNISVMKQGDEFMAISERLMILSPNSESTFNHDWINTAMLNHMYYQETNRRSLASLWLSQGIQAAYRTGVAAGLTSADQHLWWSLLQPIVFLLCVGVAMLLFTRDICRALISCQMELQAKSRNNCL